MHIQTALTDDDDIVIQHPFQQYCGSEDHIINDFLNMSFNKVEPSVIPGKLREKAPFVKK
jgi:hypothetical protein